MQNRVWLLDGEKSHTGPDRQDVTNTFTSPGFIKNIREHGIELVSFGDLIKEFNEKDIKRLIKLKIKMKTNFFTLTSVWLLNVLFSSCIKSPLENITIARADIEKAGSSIPASDIGEPVGSVKLYPARWIEADGTNPAYAVVEGSIMPVDPEGWPINFRVLLPSTWSKRAMQRGGGGMNGTITVNQGYDPLLSKGFVLYGSDSGHQSAMMGGRPPQGTPQGSVPQGATQGTDPQGIPQGVAPQGGAQGTATQGRLQGGMPQALPPQGFVFQQAKPLATGPTTGDEWALNEEAIKNLGYMQMKKTHDAVMVIIKRIYGVEPDYNYYVGTSQGGREALTVAQRYPRDYDGIISNVPIVNFSSLMLGPELIRIQEKPLDNWVTPAKVKTITAEILRQCDGLDGLSDGIISNYIEAREIFNVNDGVGPEDPWAALRGPNGTDPDPDDSTASAKLSDGQIRTLELSYSTYNFATPLANGVTSFGMWLPCIEPDGSGLITGERFRGQEGAGEDARMHTHLGILGVTGFLMKDLSANPLDYVEGGQWNSRREVISEWLDSTDPDLKAFYRRGGKIIITIGTADNLASDGAQLDYYQSLINEMGQSTIDKFARLFVVQQGSHSLSTRNYSVNGEGEPMEIKYYPPPDANDRIEQLIAWVEKGRAPAKTLAIGTNGNISEELTGEGYLMCSYPNYAKYVGGPADQVSSYVSTSP